MTSRTDRPVELLLVDDNPGDIRLLQEALREGKVPSNRSVATDGSEAMDFLRRSGRFADAARPDLILLDLNLPRKSGMTVLAEIRSDATLSQIPVIVLTSSAAEEDIARAYELRANCYITKPLDLEQFFRVVRAIEDFWLTVAKLPHAG
jgi:chemotaxis family two-component system response regulator Rcp1